MGLKEMRLSRGWSQSELAQIAGLSDRTIQRLEAGRPASLEAVRALAAAFETTPDTVRDTLDVMPGAQTGPRLLRRVPQRWQGFSQHVLIFAMGLAIVAMVSRLLNADPRLFAGIAMLWGAVLLLQLAWRLRLDERGVRER